MNAVRSIIAALAVACLFVGCSTTHRNGFAKFYVDHSAAVESRCLPYSGNTQVFTTVDPQRDITRLYQDGYVLIGESNFWSVDVPVTQQMLEQQARMVEADTALYFCRDEGTEQRYRAVQQYHPATPAPTMTQNMNVYVGDGGAGEPFGRMAQQMISQTPRPTPSGTYTTTWVPVTSHRYSHRAGFWRKAKPPIFGAYLDNLTPEIRQKLQRNTGALIVLIINDSPAFLANFLPGDIIIRMDATDISSAQDFLTRLRDHAGKKVSLEILRDGKSVTIPVQLREAD